MESADSEPTSASGASAIKDWEKAQMHVQRKEGRGEARPVIVTAIVAVVATAGILLNDLGPGNASQDSGNAGMIAAAAVSSAGAIEISSEPPTGQSAS